MEKVFVVVNSRLISTVDKIGKLVKPFVFHISKKITWMTAVYTEMSD